MLLAREARVWKQQRLLEEYRCPLVCFTMNIPGPMKRSPLIIRSFHWGLQQLERHLKGIVYRETREEVTGCEAYFAIDADALEVKRLCTQIDI